jgi:acyl-CoA thioesterase FadM
MARTRKYYLKNNYLTLRFKGQGPTKVITVCDTPPYGHAHTNYLSMKFCWIYLNYFAFRSKVKVPQRSLQYATHHLMVMHPHTNYHWPISKDKNVMARTRKYYLKNNYLTLRSKVKVPGRSLRYATHCLMVMHIRTICPWTVLLNLFKLFDLEVKGKGPTRSLRYVTHRLMIMHPHTNYHWPTSKDKNVMARTRKYYLKNNYLTARSKVKVPRRSLRYATHRLMVTHIRNITDHSRKTKKSWFGQASLRRSGRKNQTKTICLPSFEEET